jgi:hypothetical protein
MPVYNFLIYSDDKRLLYSKYNFNFEKFIIDYELSSEINPNPDKQSVFRQFLIENGSIPNPYYDRTTDPSNPRFVDIIEPYSIKEELVKYFDPLSETEHDQIVSYINRYGVSRRFQYTTDSLEINNINIQRNQFDLVEYTHDQYNRIHNYMVNVGNNFMVYSKYNFNFEAYSSDYKIYGSKLLIFSDFVFRNYDLMGYRINPAFEKYFFPMTKETLDKIVSNGISSFLPISNRSDINIDLDHYMNNNKDLGLASLPETLDYIYQTGQFELRTIRFIDHNYSPMEQAKLGVCAVSLNIEEPTPTYSGFLYKNKYNDYFLITTYELIKDYKHINIIYGLFENKTRNQMIAFRIIGYDVISNILMAIYDPNINYNKVYKPDISLQRPLSLKKTNITDQTKPVYLIGDMDCDDNLNVYKADIVKINYGGGFGIRGSKTSMPESMILKTYTYHTMIGSPVLYEETINGISDFYVCGVLINNFEDNESYSSNMCLALNNIIMINVMFFMILRWKDLMDEIASIQESDPTYEMSPELIDERIKDGSPKAWLGIETSYYTPKLKYLHPEFVNFNYIGGLVLTNIIVGINTKTDRYIYTSYDLADKAVIRLYSPLENTLLHRRFIENGQAPIVIKKIRFYDCISDSLRDMYLGKYDGQESYSRYSYGHQYILYKPSPPNSINPSYFVFPPIYITYFYYNGNNWIEEEIQVGSTENDFIVRYNVGKYDYIQNKFEYPMILNSQMNPYVLDN